MDLDITIQGAPNFRAPDEESLNVFGVRPFPDYLIINKADKTSLMGRLHNLLPRV